MQNFRALVAPPPDPHASSGWGLCPQTPSLRRLGLRPQTPIGLRRLGAPSPDPQNSLPHSEILATRLIQLRPSSIKIKIVFKQNSI